MIALVLAVASCGLSGGVMGARAAWADESSTTDSSAGNDGAQSNATQSNATQSNAVTLTLVSSTSTVTSTSGYAASIRVANGTGERLEAGTLTAFVNDRYVFSSSLLMQDWADGKAQIATPRVLAQTQVEALEPGAEQVVSVSADAGSLQDAFDYWGPKPVLFQYTPGSTDGNANTDANTDANATITLHTFVTRGRDDMGLNTTPAINVVVAMPITTDGWTTVKDATGTLISTGALPNGMAEPEDALIPSDEAKNRAGQETSLVVSHPRIQTVADQTAAQASSSLSVAANLQPNGFDISAYAQLSHLPWQSAGMDASLWKAGADVAPGTSAAKRANIAWQGQAEWTAAGLTTAKQQGYDTVVAESGFDPAYPDAVSTGKTTVTTDAGDVTVLVAQKELSTLAQGRATSADATGEASSSGQINRFVAQAALYQMERPYESRTLLVSLKDAADLGEVDAIMESLESSSWVSLSTLQSLIDASTDESNVYSLESDDATRIGDQTASTIAARVNALASNGSSLTRFATAVLDVSPAETAASADASKTNDPNALARQDANATQTKTSQAAADWMNAIIALHTRIVRLSMSMDAGADTSLLAVDGDLVNALYDGVTIAPSDSISTVSETGSMPITISNQLPFAVAIQAHADTDSDSIVVSEDAKGVQITARGESQVTFPLRIIQTGRTTATFTLLDRTGQPFGKSTTSAVHSVLRISDMSGTAILVLAGVLGVLGLWRQFTRKKDPDQ